MTKPDFKKIGFIGLGLMGGSLALLIKKKQPQIKLYAIAKHQKTIDEAKKQKLIESGGTSIKSLPTDLDLVFICTPISNIPDQIKTISKHTKTPLMITDIGSTKTTIIKKTKLNNPQHCFIAGHPMAGSEKTGLSAASSDLIANATYILIPNKNPKYKQLQRLISDLGFKVLELTAETHDALVCAASHMPYLMAVAAAATAKKSIKNQTKLFWQIASSGFRDTTRVAGCAPEWGTDVLLNNKKHALKALDTSIQTLTYIKTLIKNSDKKKLTAFLKSVQDFKTKKL